MALHAAVASPGGEAGDPDAPRVRLLDHRAVDRHHGPPAGTLVRAAAYAAASVAVYFDFGSHANSATYERRGRLVTTSPEPAEGVAPADGVAIVLGVPEPVGVPDAVVALVVAGACGRSAVADASSWTPWAPVATGPVVRGGMALAPR